MARLPRLDVVGVAQHIIQRGNNRHICFGSDEDMAAYMEWLDEYAKKFEVSIHAWVLMTNHVHLLVTPNHPKAVSKMMQSLGRRYVQYFNFQYQRTGTLWEGRYRSCLVQDEEYLLKCYRYIELNPVRANMVDQPHEYRWSSYHSNALGMCSKIITFHPEYERLGKTIKQRQECYQDLFKGHISQADIKEIRSTTNRGLVLGNDIFKDQVESLSGRRVRSKKPGRPKKSEPICT